MLCRHTPKIFLHYWVGWLWICAFNQRNHTMPVNSSNCYSLLTSLISALFRVNFRDILFICDFILFKDYAILVTAVWPYGRKERLSCVPCACCCLEQYSAPYFYWNQLWGAMSVILYVSYTPSIMGLGIHQEGVMGPGFSSLLSELFLFLISDYWM